MNFSPCIPSIILLHPMLSSLPPLSLHNNGICFINFLELLHSCCPDLIVSKQIGVGFSPLFGTWRVNGGLSVWIDTSDYKFSFYDFTPELYLLSFSLCCLLLLSVVNLVFARKKRNVRYSFVCCPRAFQEIRIEMIVMIIVLNIHHWLLVIRFDFEAVIQSCLI